MRQWPFTFLQIPLLLAVMMTLAACNGMANYEDPEGPLYAESYAQGLPPEDGHLLVVSYNVQFGENIETATAELQVNPALRALDLLLMQEIDERDADQLARSLDLNYVYAPASVHDRHQQNFGNAIFSPWPLDQFQKISLPHENPRNGQRRIAVSATITVEGETMLAYSVHTETWWLTPRQRQDQIHALLDTVSPDIPQVIIGGDFNTMTPIDVSNLDAEFSDYGFERASAGAGASVQWGPVPLPLDHIYTRALVSLANGIVEDATASDHLPLWVLLDMMESAS